MAKKEKIRPGTVFLSDRLQRKFERIKDYPLTVVEAPMGYGKTMSTKEFLKSNKISHIWQSTLDSSTHYFWKQFCSSFSAIDPDVAEELLTMGPPTDRIISCSAARLMNTVSLPEELYYILDDYQLVQSPELDLFFEVLVRESIEKLHIVLIGRSRFGSNREELELKGFLHSISEKHFQLSKEECKKYYDSCGIHLSNKDVRQLYRMTEGWISALYLFMLRYMETGDLSTPYNIAKLFENSVYSQYDEEMQELLLRICIFNQFTLEQAEYVGGTDKTKEMLMNIVSKNGFIVFEEYEKHYRIHNLFANFLRIKLDEQKKSFQNEVFRNGAAWHFTAGEYFLATLYYYNCRDYEKMLISFEKDKGNSLTGRSKKIMIEAFTACPREIKRKYPMASLIYIKQLSMMNEGELMANEIRELRQFFEDNSLPEEEKNELMGEYQMLLSFLSYNDVNKMAKYHKKAEKYLQKPSSIESAKGCWTYGAPSVLYMFYREPGSLDQLIVDMKDTRETYYKLTNGNGKGGEFVLESEAHYYRGEFDQAEILSFKALNTAISNQQIGVITCALFMQARLCMVRGDTPKGIATMNRMREMVADSKEYLFMHTAEMCMGYIFAVLRQPKNISRWLRKGEFDNKALYYPALSFLNMVYGKILLDNEEYSQYLGIADSFMEEADVFPNLLAKIYFNIYQAIAYRRLGNFTGAVDYIHKALDTAAPDRLTVPFVENGVDIVDFLDDILIVEEQKPFVKTIKEQFSKCEKNLQLLVNTDERNPLDLLTQREREIALLVSEGKTNLEIAKALNIAEITVKKSLSNIYARLDITNRAVLARKISV